VPWFASPRHKKKADGQLPDSLIARVKRNPKSNKRKQILAYFQLKRNGATHLPDSSSRRATLALRTFIEANRKSGVGVLIQWHPAPG